MLLTPVTHHKRNRSLLGCFTILVGVQLLAAVVWIGYASLHSRHFFPSKENFLLRALAASKSVSHNSPYGFTPMVPDTHGLPNVRFGCVDDSSGAADNSNRQSEQQPLEITEIQIHIIAWRRPLTTLLDQLESADYSTPPPHTNNITFSLHIHLDGDASAGTVAAAQAATWSHGPIQWDMADRNRGLRSMWLTEVGRAAAAAADTTLLLVLEDDMRVAPTYMQWILAVTQRYARTPACRDTDLVGFSLSPLKLEEYRKPFTRWDAQEALGVRNNNLHRHLAYLAAVPSSWGAVYFADQWRDFDRFVQVRMRAPFYNVTEELRSVKDYSEYRMTPLPALRIPKDARSNVWPQSWKRFMVDFMYARGLVMLYPNLPGEMGLATALQEDGEHVGRKSTTYQNPRVADLVPHDRLDFATLGNLPRYGDLAVFNLFLEPTTKQVLAEEGEAFLQNIERQCAECSELVDVLVKPGYHVQQRQPFYLPSFYQTKRGCIADHYSSVAATSQRYEPSPTAEKFLLYEPQYGANNQLHALIEAFYWAKALHRRLVIPPLYLPRVSAFLNRTDTAGVPLARFFRLVDFQKTKAVFDKKALPPISYDDFVQLGIQPWRVLRATRSAIFDESVRLLVPDKPTVSLRPFLDESISVHALQERLGGCDDQVLAFDGLFYAALNGVNVRDIVPDVLQTSPEVEKVVRAVRRDLVQALGSSEYACYHVRMGDFEEMCAAMANWNSDSTVSKHVTSSYLRTFSEYSCILEPDEVADMIRRENLPAFIMSDSPEKLKSTLNELPVRAVTSDWTFNAIRAHTPETTSEHEMDVLSLLIDQRLCADSTYAFLNRFSTVSQRVLSLRRRKGFQYFKPK